MMYQMKLNQVNNPLITNNGIFKILNALHPNIEWLGESKAITLDINYYIGHSGEKIISPLYAKLIEADENTALTIIANIIYNKFIDNWNKIYEAYTTEYQPLENYRMVENEKVKSKVINTVGTNAGLYGFNSDEAQPTNEVHSTSTTEGSKDDNDRDLTRSGNIGVTTSQQMLQSELDLRTYKFYDQVMNDIDTVLCLKCY